MHKARIWGTLESESSLLSASQIGWPWVSYISLKDKASLTDAHTRGNNVSSLDSQNGKLLFKNNKIYLNIYLYKEYIVYKEIQDLYERNKAPQDIPIFWDFHWNTIS